MGKTYREKRRSGEPAPPLPGTITRPRRYPHRGNPEAARRSACARGPRPSRAAADCSGRSSGCGLPRIAVFVEAGQYHVVTGLAVLGLVAPDGSFDAADPHVVNGLVGSGVCHRVFLPALQGCRFRFHDEKRTGHTLRREESAAAPGAGGLGNAGTVTSAGGERTRLGSRSVHRR